jgi:alkylhydroperoxidase/carboxymuconolactone decarboxylase family protein YurZ
MARLLLDSTASQEQVIQPMAVQVVVVVVDSMVAPVVVEMVVHMVAGLVQVTPVAKQEILEQVGVIVIQMGSPQTAGIPEDNLAFLFHPD